MLGGGWSRNGILGDVSWGRSVSREAEASVHGVWCVVVVKGGLSFVVASAGRTREMGGGRQEAMCTWPCTGALTGTRREKGSGRGKNLEAGAGL